MTLMELRIMNRTKESMLGNILETSTLRNVEKLLASLPVVDSEDYHFDHDRKGVGKWRDGHLHWLPVGLDRGNGGRIKLAGRPTNPIAERLVNGQEAIIELARLRELAMNPDAPMPRSPREAVLQYFGLPSLDSIPRVKDAARLRELKVAINDVRKRLYVRLYYSKEDKEFAIAIRDEGMGQEPHRVHKTLLSLGQTDKGDKPYMIGIFGQGGSSAFSASEYSIIVSRRAPDLISPGGDGGVGWTIVRQIFPRNRRDPYFAYLAADETGAVPQFDADTAEAVDFTHGCLFAHIDYDFGKSSAAVARMLYQALNHVLFNPMLPYNLFTLDKEHPELMQGTAQRLARQAVLIGRDSAIDKIFSTQAVGDAANRGPR